VSEDETTFTLASEAVAELTEKLDLYAEGADIEALHAIVWDLTQAYKQLGITKAALESELLTQLADEDEWSHEMEGMPTVVRHIKKAKVRTDGALLLGRVASDFADKAFDAGTGEQTMSFDEFAQALGEEIADVTGIKNASHSWKSGELKKRNIILSKYQDYEDAGHSIEWQF
jgi:hypothetical protein